MASTSQLNCVGSSEPPSESSELIKQAILALKELRSHYHNAVNNNTPEGSPGTLDNTTSETATPNELKARVAAVQERSEKLRGLDKLIVQFQSIFPSEQWTTAHKDRADAVSQRLTRRLQNTKLQTQCESESPGVELDGRQQQQLELQKIQEHFQQQIDKKDADLADLNRRFHEDATYYHARTVSDSQSYAKLQNEYKQCQSKLEKADLTNEALRTKIATLEADKRETEKRNESLEVQIAKLEGKRGKETVAGGVYSASEADPTSLAAAAREIKRSLTDFARGLMDKLPTQEAKAKFVQARHAGMEFRSRRTDIKYVFQEWAAMLAFQGLWECEDFSYTCLPHCQGIEKTKTLFFDRYRQLMSTHASQVVAMLLKSQGSVCQVCAHDACHCGWMEFYHFFLGKRKALVEDSGYRSLSISGDLETVSEETAGSEIGQLLQDFVALVTSLWRLYLLTLAFEQPAAMFKVRTRGVHLPTAQSLYVQSGKFP